MTFGAALVVASMLAAPPPEPASADEARRSGLYGYGIGLELPMVGIAMGWGGESNTGKGYNLGAALGWEVTPTVLLRWYLLGGTTLGAAAPVGYLDQGETVTRRQPAAWLQLETGLGAAYLFEGAGGRWGEPYVGIDAGLAFCGYEYFFDEELSRLQATRDLTTTFDEGGLYGTGFSLAVSVRGGVRLSLADWLLPMVELSLSYLRLTENNVSNTIETKRVQTVPEHLFLLRMTFSVRVGL